MKHWFHDMRLRFFQSSLFNFCQRSIGVSAALFSLVFFSDCSNTSSPFILQRFSIPLDQEQSNNKDWIVAEEAVSVRYENS